MARQRSKYVRIVLGIYLVLPYTLLKQFFFYRFRKAPVGLPDFLCIGTQKSGTTWLYDQLRQHPAICLATPKEVHYFDWYFFRSFHWYFSHFNCKDKKLLGEITPGYSVIEKGRIKFMKRIMPEVKLILLLRDPRERAWSSARFHFGKQLGRNLNEVGTGEFIQHFNMNWVKQRGDYETILKKWSSVFPKKQIHVVFTESISMESEKVMNGIYCFLNLESPATFSGLSERQNKSDEMEMPQAIREYLNDFYLPMIKRMPEWLGMENLFWEI